MLARKPSAGRAEALSLTWCSSCLPLSAADFPRPEEPKANLANNHLGYAITWFGLALTLLGGCGLLHLRPQEPAERLRLTP